MQPVGRRVSVKWPTSMPATSVMELAMGLLSTAFDQLDCKLAGQVLHAVQSILRQ